MFRIFRLLMFSVLLPAGFTGLSAGRGSELPYPRVATVPVPLGLVSGMDSPGSKAVNDVVATLKPGESKTFQAQYSFDTATANKIQIVRGDTSLPDFISFDIDSAEWIAADTVEIEYRLTAAQDAPEGIYSGIMLWQFLDFSMTVVTSRDSAIEIKVSEADVFTTLMPGQLQTYIVQYSFDPTTASQLRYVRAVLSFPDFITFGFNAGSFVGSETVAVQYRLTASKNAPGGVYKAAVIFEFLDSEEQLITTRELKFEITIDAPLPPDDHGDNCSTATQIALNSNLSGNISAGGDRDFFRVSVPEPGSLTAYTTGLTDVLGTLYGTTCSPLASDDNSGMGNNFQITEPVGPGTYYISVRHVSASSSGSYTLVVEFEPLDSFQHELYFPQLANGGGLSSQFSLLSLSTTSATNALILIRDDQGEPLSIGLIPQETETVRQESAFTPGTAITVPASGLVSFTTDGMGAPLSGSLTIRSDQPLMGVLVFGGSFGLAGVDSSPAITTRALVPIETNQATGTNTGIALQNLEDYSVTFFAALLDASGNALASATPFSLPAHGHRALFPDQLVWGTVLDFTALRGVLRVSTTNGRFAATVLLTRPGQLASLPVGVAPSSP